LVLISHFNDDLQGVKCTASEKFAIRFKVHEVKILPRENYLSCLWITN